jgi:hypothetical protein
MISTPVAASACELSCWLRQAHSDCGPVASDLNNQENGAATASDTDMSSMDMGSMDMRFANLVSMDVDSRDPGSNTSIAARPMAMPRESPAELRSFALLARPEMRRIWPGDGASLHLCGLALCGRVSLSASPPGSLPCQHAFASLAAIGVVNPAYFCSGGPRNEAAALSRAILESRPLVHTLRI